MKDCEPRDWPHLPDSQAHERPHWIIPHNASGTKAQQLTPERMMKKGGMCGGHRMGRDGGVGGYGQLRLTAGHEAARAHTHPACSGKTKACGTGITHSALLFHTLLRLFSAPPSLTIPPPPPCSQEDLKYQYPFLLDSAFSLQSAFCCPFIVKTSGEIPHRNILSTAAVPAPSAVPLRPAGRVYRNERAHALSHSAADA